MFSLSLSINQAVQPRKAAMTILRTLLLFLTMGGCASTTYRVGDQTFPSREEAESAHQEQIRNTASMIHTTTTPAGGNVLVSLPTLKKIEQSGIKVTAGSKKGLSDDVIGYLCNFMMREYEALANALKLRNIFSEVTTKYSDNPQNESITGYKFLIYLYNPDPGTAAWYIKADDWAEPRIVTMQGTNRLEKTLSWLDNIEKLAHNKL